MAKKKTKPKTDTKAKPKKQPTQAELAKKRKADRVKALQGQIGKQVAMSRSTADACLALVVTFDRHTLKAEDLKPVVGGLKAQIQGHRDEILAATREYDAKGTTADARAALGKKLVGLEKDISRWNAQLTAKQEELAGHKEARKAAVLELLKLIREKADGGLLFDQPKDGQQEAAASGGTPTSPAPSAASPSTPSPASSKAPSASTTSAPASPSTETAPTPPRSTSPAAPSASARATDPLADIPLVDHFAKNMVSGKAYDLLKEAGCRTLADARDYAVNTRTIKGIPAKDIAALEAWIKRAGTQAAAA